MYFLESLVRNSFGVDTTVEKMDFWFDIFNDSIFNGSLKKPTFSVRRMRGYHGWCIVSEHTSEILVSGNDIIGYSEYIYEIEMHSTLKLESFLDTLLHEMVHLYQSQVLKNHDMPEPEDDIDGTFKEFQTKLENFGIFIL